MHKEKPKELPRAAMAAHTCEHSHGSVHGVDIAADQHLHEEVEELGPGLGPVPVGNG